MSVDPSLAGRDHRGLPWPDPIDDVGQEWTPTGHLISADASRNDWLVVDRVTVVDREVERRFDVVLHLNVRPVAVVEEKEADVPEHPRRLSAEVSTFVRPTAFRVTDDRIRTSLRWDRHQARPDRR